jgi:hypothetical protein
MQSSGRDFDQYLRKQQEEAQRLEAMNKAKKKRIRKKVTKKDNLDVSNVSTDLDRSDPNSSLTDAHAQMLEDALKSTKKNEKNEKIFVKIQTPKKKTPMKVSPAKKLPIKRSATRRSPIKKKKVGSAKKIKQRQKTEEKQTDKVKVNLHAEETQMVEKKIDEGENVAAMVVGE